MHPRELQIEAFHYTLPEEKVARYPLEKRDQSKLLVWKKGLIAEDKFLNLAAHLLENSLIIFNNTKVVEARLLFKKTIGNNHRNFLS
jgi:S-adenosylmethionine:tRNA ribosyltransferase-isomerase